jgi:hypothetical protein
MNARTRYDVEMRESRGRPLTPTGGMGSSGSIPDYVKMFGQVFLEEGFTKLPN